MKNLIKKIIFKVLEWQARLVLWRYKPQIIAITGTVGKTTTKDAIYEVLSNFIPVRANKKSFNSEIGVPLTILDLDSGWNNLAKWLKNILVGFGRIFYNPNFPKWLILEAGIDRPNDMKKLVKWLKPDIAIITAFGKVPVHVEYFDSIEDVIYEKSLLALAVKENGHVILNADDEQVLKLKSKLKVKTHTYSLNNYSDFQASNYEICYENDLPIGITYKLNFNGNAIPIRIKGAVGEPLVYSSLPALICASLLELSMTDAGMTLLNYKPTPGRLNLLAGKNESLIIDDSYNASPVAVQSAIQVLSELKNFKMKILIVGDMLELGKFSASEHRFIGKLVAEKKIGFLMTVGFRSELIAEEALKNGYPEDRIFKFKDSQSAIGTALKFLEKGSVFLIKGSQSMRMEKIIENLILEEDKKAELLIRQEKEWQNK